MLHRQMARRARGRRCARGENVIIGQERYHQPTVAVRTIIQLRDEQAAALDRAARRRGVSKAALVREALDVLLARDDGDEALERALRAAGSGASGLDDLAERHDAYLAEKADA